MLRRLQILLPYLGRYRRGLVKGVAALGVRNIAAAAIPLGIGYAVDELSSGFQIKLAVQFALLLVALTALKGIFQYAMRVVLIGISRDIEYDIRNDLFRHLIRLSADFYGRYRTGDIMARTTNDLSAVRNMLGPGIMYSGDTLLTAILAVGVMGWVDWRLTLFALLPAPIVSVLVRYFGHRIHERFREIQTIFSEISNRVQENLTGVRVVRAYVQEDSEKRLFEEWNRDYIKESLRLARLSAVFLPMLHSFTGIAFLIVLWYGGNRLMDGKITLGAFLMFNVYLGMLIRPMVAMGWVVNVVQRGTTSLARLEEILNEQPSITDPPRPVAAPQPVRGEVRFEDAGLAFGDTEVLREINIRIEAGSTVALVGPTGSGKSSLAQLIPRLWDPTAGRILLDGIDLRNLRLADLRRAIGFAPQETFLFSATLAENIAFGHPSATMEQIRRSAELAGLGPDVGGFPDGYDTVVGERGITLSGGQKQRTAIARAILGDPSVLVLDDALSSVDTETEELILNALGDLVEDRTTIVISHRVSTVRRADVIFVMDRGRIVEQGNHASLLAGGHWYADLHQKQLLERELEAI